MKKESISEILSGINDCFIEEASDISKKKDTHLVRYIAVAACFVIILIAGIFISQSDFVSLPPVSTEETTSNDSGGGDKNVPEISPAPETVTEPAIETVTDAEMMIMPQWADLSVPMRYSEATLKGITYSTTAAEISEENILSFLSGTEMTGYDIYTDTVYTVNAEIYSVESISTDCAVAIKIDGGEKYYVYINSWYEPETLGDFIRDLDLKNTVSFRKAYIDEYNLFENGSGHKQTVYADFDDSVIWNMLEDVLSAKNVEYNHPYDRIGVETDLSVLGYKNVSFSITPDGYIITNILGTQKCFFVGTEKFTEFDRYLKDNVPFKEYNTVYENNPDGTISGKGEDTNGQSTSGYNPDAPVEISPPYNPDETVFPDYYIPNSSSAPPYIPEDFIAEETTKIR